jgi:hypothetical protein
VIRGEISSFMQVMRWLAPMPRFEDYGSARITPLSCPAFALSGKSTGCRDRSGMNYATRGVVEVQAPWSVAR